MSLISGASPGQPGWAPHSSHCTPSCPQTLPACWPFACLEASPGWQICVTVAAPLERKCFARCAFPPSHGNLVQVSPHHPYMGCGCGNSLHQMGPSYWLPSYHPADPSPGPTYSSELGQLQAEHIFFTQKYYKKVSLPFCIKEGKKKKKQFSK